MSERDAAGKLTSIPGIVEAEATKPNQKPSGVSRLVAKGFKTGFLDIVELRIAKSPIMQSIQNTLSTWFLRREAIKSQFTSHQTSESK